MPYSYKTTPYNIMDLCEGSSSHSLGATDGHSGAYSPREMCCCVRVHHEKLGFDRRRLNMWRFPEIGVPRTIHLGVPMGTPFVENQGKPPVSCFRSHAGATKKNGPHRCCQLFRQQPSGGKRSTPANTPLLPSHMMGGP